MLRAGRDAGQIGDMAHHVSGEHRVGAAVLGNDVLGELAIEEGADGADAEAARDIGDIDRRLNAEMAHPAFVEVAQHDAVIAAKLDHKRIGAPFQNARHHRPGEGLEVHLHVARGARIERIIAMEHLVGLRLLDKLKHAAPVAEGRRELEEILVMDFLIGEKCVGDRHAAK